MLTIARKQTLVQLSDELIRRLDARASHEGISRSAVIREAVESHLRGWDEEVARMYREAYGRHPQTEEEDEWGDIAVEGLVERLAEDEEDW